MLFDFVDNIIKIDPKEALTKGTNFFHKFLHNFHEIFPPFKNSPRSSKPSEILPKMELVLPNEKSFHSNNNQFSSELPSTHQEALIKQILSDPKLNSSILPSHKITFDQSVSILGKGYSSFVKKGRN